MATIKLCSDLQQSKKLAEILPLESSDMSWVSNGLGKPFARTIPIKGDPEELCGCWSLAALLGVLPNSENKSTTLSKGGYRISTFEQINDWFVDYEDEANGLNNCITSADNPIDACYEMILKLHELNLL